MTAGARKLAWAPPFLLGAVGAAGAELAAGLLLYSTRGFLRSLTVVLATELLALGLGFASSRRLGPHHLSAIRRRWLMAVIAFAAAAGFSAAWSMSDGFGAAAPAQIAGLALLGGFPLFAVGSVLGAARFVGREGSVAGASAAFGAAVGVAGTGLLGVPSLQPTSVFLLCVVAVSTAALLHGRQVDAEVVTRMVAEDRGSGDEPVLRLEERIRPGNGSRARLVTVDGRPGAGIDREGRPLLPWERAAEELLVRRPGGPERVLLVGASGDGLLRTLESAPDPSEVTAVEPWDRLRRLRAESGWDDRSEVPVRHDRVPAGRDGAFGAVVVALRLLPGGGPVAGSGLDLLASVAPARSPGGLLVLGGLELGAEGREPSAVDWLRRRRWSPARIACWVPTPSSDAAWTSLRIEGQGSGGGLLLGGVEGFDQSEEIGAAMAAAGMEPVPGPAGSPEGPDPNRGEGGA